VRAGEAERVADELIGHLLLGGFADLEVHALAHI
jgi:hypothetical protein